MSYPRLEEAYVGSSDVHHGFGNSGNIVQNEVVSFIRNWKYLEETWSITSVHGVLSKELRGLRFQNMRILWLKGCFYEWLKWTIT